jgi:hypothetical protein
MIPGYSKVHTDVTTNPMTEPSPLQRREVWSCKTCSVVKERKIQYESTNTSPKSVKTEAGTVLPLQLSTYKGYKSGYNSYESEEESDKEEDIQKINMDKASKNHQGYALNIKGACPIPTTATDPQENQLPVLSDFPVEDGAYPTSATAINSQENQLPISLDIAVEDGAY